jgi:hypothetical protein
VDAGDLDKNIKKGVEKDAQMKGFLYMKTFQNFNLNLIAKTKDMIQKGIKQFNY